MILQSPIPSKIPRKMYCDGKNALFESLYFPQRYPCPPHPHFSWHFFFARKGHGISRCSLLWVLLQSRNLWSNEMHLFPCQWISDTVRNKYSKHRTMKHPPPVYDWTVVTWISGNYYKGQKNTIICQFVSFSVWFSGFTFAVQDYSNLRKFGSLFT